jgi:hypothetical protein
MKVARQGSFTTRKAMLVVPTNNDDVEEQTSNTTTSTIASTERGNALQSPIHVGHSQSPQKSCSFIEEQPRTAVSPCTPVLTEVQPVKEMSRSDIIRKSLREKEKRLSALVMKRNEPIDNVVSSRALPDIDCSYSIESIDNTMPQAIVFEGKEELDRMEAIKVISQAAVSLKTKLVEEKGKSRELKKAINIRDRVIQQKEKEKMDLLQQTSLLKDENAKMNKTVMDLRAKLEGRGAALKTLQIDSQASERNVVFQDELNVARSEVEWLQRDSVSKREQFEFFEYELLSKNAEIDDIKHDLHEKVKRIVELEVDLETHDDRYNEALAEYIKHETAQLGENDDTNASLMDTPLGLEPSPTHRQPREKKRGIGRIFCHMNRNNLLKEADHEQAWGDSGIHEPPVTLEKRLRSEIASLEARYKRDLFAATMKIDELKQENNEYLIKILSLEKTMQETEKGSPQGDVLSTSRVIERPTSPLRESISNLPSRTLFLEEKVESLENELNLRSRYVENLKCDIGKLHNKAKKQMELNRDTVQMLQLENQAKEVKLATLEHELREVMKTASEGSLQKLVSLHTNVTFGLENKLRASFAERFRLYREREAKDKKIVALRQEIVELRLQQMSRAVVQSHLEAIPEESSDCSQKDNSPNSQREKAKSAGEIKGSAPRVEFIHV